MTRPYKKMAPEGSPGAPSAREALAEAWFDRATDLLERMRDEATVEQLEEALGQQTAVSGVSVLMSRWATAAEKLDELAPALVRAVKEQEQLLEEARGALSRGQVAEILDVQPPAVDQRRRRGRLLSVETVGGQHLYPACQFTKTGTLPHLAEVLSGMRVDSGWMRLDFLLSPLDPLGGRTPLQLLEEGPSEAELEELMSLVRSWGV